MSFYQNRIVIKIGTSTLINDIGKSDLHNIDRLVRTIADIHNRDTEVILVSSGAIAFGTNRLNLKSRPEDLRTKQAVSAVGQCRLTHLYDKLFEEYDKTIGQILLSEADFHQDETRDHLIKTFDTLLHMGVIPIVNENDSVNSSEIESADHLFGDNDQLSAYVARLCRACKLIIVSDIDSIYDKDPQNHPDAKPVTRIKHIDESMMNYVATRRSRRVAEGITTKLTAARYAAQFGIDTIIMNGKQPEQLYDIIRGKPVGTFISGQ